MVAVYFLLDVLPFVVSSLRSLSEIILWKFGAVAGRLIWGGLLSFYRLRWTTMDVPFGCSRHNVILSGCFDLAREFPLIGKTAGS